MKQLKLPTRRKLILQLGIAIFIAMGLRSTVAMSVHVSGESVSPELPNGSYAMVNRLANNYTPGDIVVYNVPNDHRLMLGRVSAVNKTSLKLDRNGADPFDQPRERVIGRVWMGTR